jgi:hypothetical protein
VSSKKVPVNFDDLTDEQLTDQINMEFKDVLINLGATSIGETTINIFPKELVDKASPEIKILGIILMSSIRMQRILIRQNELILRNLDRLRLRQAPKRIRIRGSRA